MKNQRKLLFNQKAFKCYRDKGFLEPYHEDRNGWFDLNINAEEIKEEILYENGLNCVRISFYHLPNGNWIASHDIFYGHHGQCGRPSIFSKDYPTKNEAIQNQIDIIVDFLHQQKAPSNLIMLVKNFLYQKEQVSLF